MSATTSVFNKSKDSTIENVFRELSEKYPNLDEEILMERLYLEFFDYIKDFFISVDIKEVGNFLRHQKKKMELHLRRSPGTIDDKNKKISKEMDRINTKFSELKTWINKNRNITLDDSLEIGSSSNKNIVERFSNSCDIDLLSLQKKMLDLKLIDHEFTYSEIEKILNHPFIKFRYLFPSSDDYFGYHEEFKSSLSAE